MTLTDGFCGVMAKILSSKPRCIQPVEFRNDLIRDPESLSYLSLTRAVCVLRLLHLQSISTLGSKTYHWFNQEHLLVFTIIGSQIVKQVECHGVNGVNLFFIPLSTSSDPSSDVYYSCKAIKLIIYTEETLRWQICY